MKKETKFTNKEFFPNLFTIHLADYLITKHSEFLFELNQKTLHAVMILKNTVAFITLEPIIED